jgi:hypothetical protein
MPPIYTMKVLLQVIARKKLYEETVSVLQALYLDNPGVLTTRASASSIGRQCCGGLRD